MRKAALSACLLLVALPGFTRAQKPLYTDAFPKEEFVERRARVMQKIGDGVAILTGAAEIPGFTQFRQNNQFFYLTGVEVPRAMVVIDGKTKRTTLFLPARNERAERSEGPLLTVEDAPRLTGVDDALVRDQFAAALARLGMEGRTVYTPFRAEALATGSPEYSVGHYANNAADPWDGRISHEAAFIQRMRAAVPQLDLRNLDPIIDEMRMIKSPREIALVREATRLAGLGMMEAMRMARPGMFEYEITAVSDYIFRKHNAQGPAYFSLIATGTNAAWPHYHHGQAQLKDGDLVLFDYSPDYKYYTADVTREFPANGRFSPEQREMYGIYLALYKALMESIRPGPAAAVVADAVRKMDAVMASFRFSNPKVKEAATRFVNAYRTRAGNRGIGHMVGMEVHDVTVPYSELKPGMIFTIEPALTIPEDRVYIRLEDMILVTDNGYENLSGFVPMEIDAVERTMAEEGFDRRYDRPST
jgi:Xaa-Pro aminopeptidase